jgi:pyruvate dehydrogenase E1 component beta subunit
MPEGRIINAAEAVREALDQALARRPEVYVLGEGVTDPKAIFGTTAGLLEKYGPARVVEMPIAENGMTGIAIGSALVGRRPILIHQRVDFALLSIEQLFNNAAKTRYVTNGKHSVPMVVRLIIGRGWGQGPQHSQSLEAVFAHIPGLKVVFPAVPADFKGLLLGAIEDGNPVLFLEHRWLHYVTGAVAPGYDALPLDGPRVVRPGRDVTVVASSYMVLEARRAADRLADIGCECEIIDLRVVRPLNMRLILDSVRRTGRLVTVDTGMKAFGVGGEIVAGVCAQAFEALKARPLRVGLPDHPTPSTSSLATVFYPGSREIAETIAAAVGLPADKATGVLKRLALERAALPIDRPDPAFRGPF